MTSCDSSKLKRNQQGVAINHKPGKTEGDQPAHIWNKASPAWQVIDYGSTMQDIGDHTSICCRNERFCVHEMHAPKHTKTQDNKHTCPTASASASIATTFCSMRSKAARLPLVLLFSPVTCHMCTKLHQMCSILLCCLRPQARSTEASRTGPQVSYHHVCNTSLTKLETCRLLISLMSAAVSCLHKSDSVVVRTMLVMDSLSCLVVSAVSALALRVSFLLIASATLFSIILHTSQDVRGESNCSASWPAHGRVTVK